MVAQDDGTIGVFTLDASGKPTVVQAGFKGEFFAQGIVVDPNGTRAWVFDENTEANGGGVFEVAIGCDGKLTSKGKALAIAPAQAMALFPGDPTKGVVASDEKVHLVDLAAKKDITTFTAFGDTEALPSSIAVTPDGKFALVADDSYTAGNRIAAVNLTAPPGDAGGPLDTPAPAAVAISPFGNAAIVLNDDSNDMIHVLSYDGTKAAPFTITGELAYKFGKPAIPVTVIVLDHGNLKGRAFIGENAAVRELTFGENGTVTDTQKLDFPDDVTLAVGVVGVQP
jgi:DNA-binding beta-propeller fold protein YncE